MRAAHLAGVAALLVGLASLPAAAQYQPPERPPDLAGLSAKEAKLVEMNEERKKKQRSYPLRTRTGRLLNAAATALEQEDGKEALRILAGLKPERLNPFERARTYLVLAHAHYANGDPPAAVEHFQKSIDEGIHLISDEAGLRFNVAQLQASLQRWPQVIESIHEWFEYTTEEKPIAHYLLAVAYYQTEQPDEALASVEKAVDMADEPKEGWLTLLAALYVSKERYDDAIPIFEELVLRFPKKQYWVQLALLWGARENYKHALAVQQIAYQQGFLDASEELVRLARSYLYHELPYPAALVLQKGIDEGTVEATVENLELLSNCWIASREYEKSLPPLSRAAEMAENGNLLVRLGQVYMQREDWEKAAELLQRALERGGLDNTGNAQLLLGISYYNGKRTDLALSSFGRAAQDAKVRQAAEGWITHIEREAQVTSETTGG